MVFLNASKVFPKLLCVIMLLQIAGHAQKQERMIDKMSWRSEPIRILQLKTRGRAIELGKNFEEEDDWLKGLTVTVKNVSDKVIARIEIEVAFPRPGGGTQEKPTFVTSMLYGLDPAEPGAEKVKLILPGESVDVKLLEVNLPLIKSALKDLGYPERITHAQIKVESVTFIDGSMWSGDDIFYPDPSDPKRKINPILPRIKPIPNAPEPPWNPPAFRVTPGFTMIGKSPAASSESAGGFP